MAAISRFEDLEAWQSARVLTRRVYEVTQSGDFSRDLDLRSQIRRAAVSVMANIAEGFDRNGNVELRQFLSVAKGSAGEVKAHLYVALDAGYLSPEQFEKLYRFASETSNLIGGFMRYLASTDFRGAKFR